MGKKGTPFYSGGNNPTVAPLNSPAEGGTTAEPPGVAVIPNPNSLLVVTCLLVFTYHMFCLVTHILVVLVHLA